MKKHLYAWTMLLFLLTFGFDLVVWGGATQLPEVGAKLQTSAQHEAPLVNFYMIIGGYLDAAVPALGAWGTDYADEALAEGFERIKGEPSVAMDLIFSQTWNAHHATLKFMHWIAPVLGVLALIFWLRRPKKIHMMGSRR